MSHPNGANIETVWPLAFAHTMHWAETLSTQMKQPRERLELMTQWLQYLTGSCAEGSGHWGGVLRHHLPLATDMIQQREMKMEMATEVARES